MQPKTVRKRVLVMEPPATTIINKTLAQRDGKNTMKINEENLDFGKNTHHSVSDQINSCFSLFFRRQLVEIFAE